MAWNIPTWRMATAKRAGRTSSIPVLATVGARIRHDSVAPPRPIGQPELVAEPPPP